MSTVSRANRIARGIGFMCAGVVLFACMNALVKLMGPHFSSPQLVWARTLSHLLFILALFMPRVGFAVFRTRQPGTQFLRSLLQIASTLLFFSALRFVPLAEATSISFLAPVLVTLLAAKMLGEPIRPSRLVVVFAGFAGVLIVVRPGSDVFQWASLLILGSATCYATYQVLTRRVTGTDSAEASAVYSALVGSVVMSLVVPYFWSDPTSAWQVVGLVTLGVLGGLGHYCVACALYNAPANIVSPFQYLQLVGAVILGYLLFDAVPTVYTGIGAVLIIASGLYLGWSETQRSPAARSKSLAATGPDAPRA